MLLIQQAIVQLKAVGRAQTGDAVSDRFFARISGSYGNLRRWFCAESATRV